MFKLIFTKFALGMTIFIFLHKFLYTFRTAIYYTPQKMFLLAFSFANFETTSGSRGKANISFLYLKTKTFPSCGYGAILDYPSSSPFSDFAVSQKFT